MHWLYENLLQPFIRVATISTVVWLIGQWLGFVAPEITVRFRRISMAIMRAVIPPQRKWYKRPVLWFAVGAIATALVFHSRKGK